MDHLIRCDCGLLQATVDLSGSHNRCVCYCSDCQAFARFLGRDTDILDQSGGTDIIQLEPARIRFTQGEDNLACMRLTKKGLLRWYASCCNTPIGNTPAIAKFSFIGLIHNCLEHGEASIAQTFGPVRMRAFTKFAIGEPRPKSAGLLRAVPRLIAMQVKALVNGSYRRNPFFVSEAGSAIVEPRVLSERELREVKRTRAV